MKFEQTKFGLKHDPRGAHVTMKFKGRELIGVVRDAYREEVTGSIKLRVHHFCGDAWPFDPMASAVDVLDRTYETTR